VSNLEGDQRRPGTRCYHCGGAFTGLSELPQAASALFPGDGPRSAGGNLEEGLHKNRMTRTPPSIDGQHLKPRTEHHVNLKPIHSHHPTSSSYPTDPQSRRLTSQLAINRWLTNTMLSQIQGETPPPNLAALAEDHYFSANPPPKDLEKHTALARDFINYHAAAGRRLVLVTSGGTTVPLGMPLLDTL
jgi:hypothetical protein